MTVDPEREPRTEEKRNRELDNNTKACSLLSKMRKVETRGQHTWERETSVYLINQSESTMYKWMSLHVQYHTVWGTISENLLD